MVDASYRRNLKPAFSQMHWKRPTVKKAIEAGMSAKEVFEK